MRTILIDGGATMINNDLAIDERYWAFAVPVEKVTE
ncbi:DUF1642 domain-containing protein [Enterococcus devriesei]|nr:DUF1642 domain-containing protein [Enterococcus devriesei]MBU5364277.1 DUF1642 domain-containing protein [Enterococcus devriesei]